MIGAKTNIDGFVFALRAKKAACQRTMPDILNHALRDVAFRAASYTPKANAARIRADLMSDPHLRYALTSIVLRKKGIRALKKPEFAAAVARFVSRRASSAAYLRSAYAKVIEQLGGSFKGAHFRGAAEGFANEATAGKLIAQMVTILSQPSSQQAASAERIGIEAINKALNFVAQDMIEYAQRKLAEAAAT
jgi:hypothetical protein